MTQPVPTCPVCGASGVVPIEYGYPDIDMALDDAAGRIELGGCVITEDDPRWACRSCRTRWA